jgi:hypothetical protein
VWNNVGILCDGDGCLLDVSCDHSDYDSCLFASVDGLRDALFQRILDSCEGQNSQVFLIDFRVLVFGLFFSEFLVANEQSPQ